MMIWTNFEDIVLITLSRVHKQQVIFSPGQVVAYQKAIKQFEEISEWLGLKPYFHFFHQTIDVFI